MTTSEVNLISIMNRIQDSFMSLKLRNPLDLPQIVVVGGQSAGKSSVLEAIVGKDFLPRGNGICTRRPLVLQLINTAPGTKEYGEFFHLKSQKFFDFHDVRDEIEKETDRLTGRNKGISYEPIRLSIHSPHVLDLTLVDLPGMTKVPIGDQPMDIEKQIEKMILHYIKKQKCLILAVTPANSDLANSDALKVAQRVDVDPEGLRTFNVITKLDLMDEGTDARDILENKLLKLRHGYIGVVNRSQQDIVDAKSMREAVTAEKEFFEDHPSYRHMADRMGTEYLKKTLHSELISHIRQSLPGLRDTLQKTSMDMDIEKENNPNFDADDTASLMRMMNEMVHNLYSDIETSISGGRAAGISTTERSVGAEINDMFNETLLEDINDIPYDNEKIEEQIRIAIGNVHGINSGVFTPDMAFEVVVKCQIDKLKQPIMKCVDSVASIMAKMVTTYTKKMEAYPKLQLDVERRVSELVRNSQKKCRDQMGLQLEIELAHMNTKHPDFVRFARQSKIITRAKKEKSEESDEDVIFASGHLRFYDDFMWCVLRKNTLSAYTDEINEKDMKRHFSSIHSVVIKNRGFFQQVFEMAYKNPRTHRFGAEKYLKLQIDCDEEDFFRWKAAFISAEMLVEQSLAAKTELERQIEEIHSFAGFYFRIVMKKMIDTTPKVIVMMLVNNCKNYIQNGLFADLQLSGQMAELMSETGEARQKREDFFKMYNACKESLKIIDEISMDMVSKTVVSNMVQTDNLKETPLATSNGHVSDAAENANDSGILGRWMRRSVNID